MKVLVVIPVVIDNSLALPWDTEDRIAVDTDKVKVFPFTDEGKKASAAYVAMIAPSCEYVEVEIKDLEI